MPPSVLLPALLLAAPPDWLELHDMPAACQTHTVQVKMRDGMALNTIVVRPRGTAKVGTILVRTPYGASAQAVTQYCNKGFAGVVQDDRGSGKSPGSFGLFARTGTDGYDTIDWITQQAWSNGKVGTTGGSALGIAQYTQLINPHPEPHPALKAVNPIVAEAFAHQLTFQGGAYRSGLNDGWLKGQGDDYLISQARAHEGWGEWWQNTSGFHSDGQVTGFDRARRHAAWGVHLAGWYDIFSTLQLQTVQELNDTGLGATAPQWLIVEPTGHCGGGAVKWANTSFANTVAGELVSALFSLKVGDPSPSEAAALQATLDSVPRLTFYVTGPGTSGSVGNFWVQAPAWPETTPTELYLADGGGLLSHIPPPTSAEYSYDPADPIKTFGGNNLVLHPCGPQDQRKVDDGRKDALTYAQPDPLAAPLAVVGNVTAWLKVGSDAKDTDFVVKLVDVWPDGTRMLVQDGVRRMRWRNGPFAAEPAAAMEEGVEYDALVVVGGVSHVFNKGHRVGVTVTSSNAPRFDANPNTGEALARNSTRKVVARNTVHQGAARSLPASRLILPVADLSALL